VSYANLVKMVRVARARCARGEDAPYHLYRAARASVGGELSDGDKEPTFDLATHAEGFRWRPGIGRVIARWEEKLDVARAPNGAQLPAHAIR
jgi:hypothetical protein